VPPSVRGPWRTLALGGPHLGDADVEEPDWIPPGPLPPGLFAIHVRQARDAVALQASVWRRAREMRDRRLQSVETVVERKQGVPPEGDDDRFFLLARNS